MKRTLLLALSLAIFAAPALFASPITTGTPGAAPGDWTQQFNETYGGPFTSMLAFMETPGVDFAATGGMSAFNDASWTSQNTNPQYTSASGNSATSLNFNFNFAPASTATPFSMDFYALNGGSVVDSSTVVWNGGSWAESDPLPANSLAGENSNAVPEPPTWGLVGGGLLLLGLCWWKRQPGTLGARSWTNR